MAILHRIPFPVSDPQVFLLFPVSSFGMTEVGVRLLMFVLRVLQMLSRRRVLQMFRSRHDSSVLTRPISTYW